jgi:hypothetical protein
MCLRTNQDRLETSLLYIIFCWLKLTLESYEAQKTEKYRLESRDCVLKLYSIHITCCGNFGAVLFASLDHTDTFTMPPT